MVRLGQIAQTAACSKAFEAKNYEGKAANNRNAFSKSS
jgi:hypothetical protein